MGGHDWRRRLIAVGLIVVLGGIWLVVLGQPMKRTAVGADGVGQGTFPVVEIAGLGSRGAGFAALTRSLQDEGVPVLDFDADQAGTQPLIYQPTKGMHIADLATKVVAPAVRDALARAGLDPDQRIDVVAHSTGGLLARYLVEHGARGVDDWRARVDDLVMVAVPNHGSWPVWLETRGGGPFGDLGSDMRPGSAFLDGLGYDEPAGLVYTTIGGDPWFFRWSHAVFGDGFDDQVPSHSPFLDGAANNVYPSFHGQLLRSTAVVSLIARTLRAS